MFDLVINPSSPNSTIQFKHEFTVKTMLLGVFSGVLMMWLLFQTRLGDGGVIGDVMWSVAYLWLSYLMIRPTNTKLQGYSYIKPMMNYVNHDYRNVSTRMAAPIAPAASIVGIKGLNQNGKLIFENNDVGEVVELAGNASILMFDADKQQVLNNVGNFYRQVKPTIGLTYDNVSAPQRVSVQLKNKDTQAANLVNNESGLMDIINSQKNIMENYVGKQFKALHQYLIVRAANYDDLSGFNEWLQMQTGQHNDDNYLKSFRMLSNPKEVQQYLKDIYSDTDLLTVDSDKVSNS